MQHPLDLGELFGYFLGFLIEQNSLYYSVILLSDAKEAVTAYHVIRIVRENETMMFNLDYELFHFC